MDDILKDNSKYDLKTIKLKPDTYNKLVMAKKSEADQLHHF
ncbi:MAG: hypothetical protein V1859_00010 [archaeon]